MTSEQSLVILDMTCPYSLHSSCDETIATAVDGSLGGMESFLHRSDGLPGWWQNPTVLAMVHAFIFFFLAKKKMSLTSSRDLKMFETLKTGHVELSEFSLTDENRDSYVCTRPSRFNAICFNKDVMKNAADAFVYAKKMNQARPEVHADVVAQNLLSSDASSDSMLAVTPSADKDKLISGFYEGIIDSLPLLKPDSAIRTGDHADTCYRIQYPMLGSISEVIRGEWSFGMSGEQVATIKKEFDTLLSSLDPDTKDPALILCASSKADAAYSFTGQAQSFMSGVGSGFMEAVVDIV